jgi:hypothetical protein
VFGGLHQTPIGDNMPSERNSTFNAKVVLINIGREWREGLTPDQLYERTRRYWRCNPANHDAEYAVSVANGIVREVYRIDGWDPVDLRKEKIDPTRQMNTPPPKTLDRWAFRGEVAGEMQHYLGTKVSHYRRHGNADPLIWLNCKKTKQAGIDG